MRWSKGAGAVLVAVVLVAAGALGAVAVGALGDDGDVATTPLTVRVVAAGAKWVSPELGGADVYVTDAESGETLAHAQLEGDSGDTDALMDQARTRAEPVPTTATSAKAVLDVPLTEPRQVVVSAHGPRVGDGPVTSTSTTVWMVPGRSLGGSEGVVLELQGLAVSFLEPTPHEVRTSAGPVSVPVRAAVEMLCGCPIGPTTPWAPEDYRVDAVAVRDGEEVARAELSYAGSDSRFSGELELPGPGVYELQIVAEQIGVANMGVARNGLVVQAPADG